MTPSAHRGHRTTFLPAGGEHGFSMSEMVIVISIMGALAGIAVLSFGQFLGGSKDALAMSRQETLNQSVHRFAQQNYELLFDAMNGSVADELVILRTLQYRDPNIKRAQPGSPFMDPRYNPVSSSDASVHRLRWTGKLFELLKPGKSGTGILMNFEGTDFTTAFVFPPNFKTAGR
ncbi:type II secretion system protein [Prosthecobacter sp.]|uniref:type II secretion system protein n=1 Tax=Prosthecobacter sp. TaxID=1965333 RepID=UPI00248A3586|nr:type II secretion system protein [Prosthecobacter sp.]MDI1312831.1 type II secretion system protein [Prosthecobacter sp.]